MRFALESGPCPTSALHWTSDEGVREFGSLVMQRAPGASDNPDRNRRILQRIALVHSASGDEAIARAVQEAVEFEAAAFEARAARTQTFGDVLRDRRVRDLRWSDAIVDDRAPRGSIESPAHTRASHPEAYAAFLTRQQRARSGLSLLK